VQSRELGEELVFQVEGRLAGACVPELEQLWSSACAGPAARYPWI